ncbi:MAG: DUF4303 domain-containing protein [Clostridiales bacterium]|nr:DUF4303 domain-containing protein [Clostridiales bacterium]
MFDYEKFENSIFQQMIDVFNSWIEENDDLYIFSLDCAREMDSIGVVANTTHYLEEQAEVDSEDYWYYKYCEEEWDLFDTFETVSADMQKYLDDNENRFTNPETYEYTELFDKHCDQMIEHCKNALIRFKQAINKNHSDILLTFNIREYLDGDERVEIFQAVNSENASREYSEHIEEFE